MPSYGATSSIISINSLVPLAGTLFLAISRSGSKTVTIQCDRNGIVAEKSVQDRRDKWTGDWTWESLQPGN